MINAIMVFLFLMVFSPFLNFRVKKKSTLYKIYIGQEFHGASLSCIGNLLPAHPYAGSSEKENNAFSSALKMTLFYVILYYQIFYIQSIGFKKISIYLLFTIVNLNIFPQAFLFKIHMYFGFFQFALSNRNKKQQNTAESFSAVL